MLKLVYTPTVVGPPASYGDTLDTLTQLHDDAPPTLLQQFRKAGTGLAPPEPALATAIDTWLANRPQKSQPVIVMVHGFLYDPGDTTKSGDNPFDSTYAPPSATNKFNLSWLPLVGECDDTGVPTGADNAIAFAYTSESGLLEVGTAGWSNFYQLALFDQSPLAGRALATILAQLGTHADVKLRILAHSLGTRTTSQAIRTLRTAPVPNLDRIVMLDGAEFCIDAAVNFTNCGFDVINVCNRRDKVLTIGAEQACIPFRPAGIPSCVIGRDALGDNPSWLDLRFDDPVLRAWFAGGHAPGGNAYTIDPDAEEDSHSFAHFDHWSCFTNLGNRLLVFDLLHNDAMTTENFISHHVPPVTDCPVYPNYHAAIPDVPGDALNRRRLDLEARIDRGVGLG